MRNQRLHILMVLATLFAASIGTAWAATASAQTSFSLPASPGDLIRGETFSAVYYLGEDGFRYVFPNEKTYFTWYSDFSTVKWLTDDELGAIQIGGNVTYKPGAKMIKIDSDPRTYAVDEGGVIRHVESESLAAALYGSGWNTMVDDVPDGFFTNYTVGEPIDATSDFSVTEVTATAASIGDDKHLSPYELVFLTDVGIQSAEDGSPNAAIAAGDAIAFFNSGAEKHSATAEDGSWGTGTIVPGGWYVVRFSERGDYAYFDTYFEENTATVTVE